ncbi:MAG TPA: hypothetical protein VGC79_00535 [Polyangiaceae bacterium]
MPTLELYNLDLGKSVSGHWAKAQVGPFEVALVPEYEERRASLPVHGSKTVTQNFADGNEADDPLVDVRTVDFAPTRRGGWVVTATASQTAQEPPVMSVLAREPIPDHGVWDLCTLLTFTTGRRVATAQNLDRFNPNCYGAPACIAIETLHATALAWKNRDELVKRNLVYAVQMHNEALGFAMLQVAAGLNNAALNVLVDRWTKRPSSPDPQARRALKVLVTAAIDNCSSMSAPDRDAFKAILGSRIDQGLGSLTERTRAMLRDLDVIGAEPNADVDRRIGFANTIRNRLVHSGEPPLLKGLSMEQSMRYTTAIATGVVPGVTIAAIGQVLGFRSHSLGSLSQNVTELKAFFQHGTWRDWPLEEKAFDDWFYGELQDIEDATASGYPERGARS